ncbi:NAD-dependent epimerase/dehydratase family protein, partial [Actinomycetota bacterium]
VLVSGVGALGMYAVELLARSSGVDRIVTVKRSPWRGPSRVNLTMIGAVFQGHAKQWRHHQIDFADTGAMAQVLDREQPDVILHAAAVQSPRRLMNATVDARIRDLLRSATFGMWLPWHLLPAARLMQAIDAAGINTTVVNASFPDIVNPAIHARFGHGPEAGAGNVEVCVAQIARYMADVESVELDRLKISLVGSHALLAHGPDVPHHLQVEIDGQDVTDRYDLETMLTWPERIAWSKVDDFSLFSASAVKNVLALLDQGETRTHVSGPLGLTGGYPALIRNGRIHLDLPDGLDRDTAIAINERAAAWDGIARIETDGTVVYTDKARRAMGELGCPTDAVESDRLEERSDELSKFYERITTMEGINA